MKKVWILILIAALSICSFVGCKQEEEISGNVDPIESYDNESVYVPELSTDGDSSQSPSGNFVVKDKKYTYEGNDLVVLNIENKTEVNYVISVTGTCLDADGNVLYTETQEFDQFASGHKHFFIFQPKMKFDKFEYDFAVEETDARMYINDFEFVFGGLEEVKFPVEELVEQNGDYTYYPMIMADCGYRNNSKDGTNLHVACTWIIYNDRDEVVATWETLGKLIGPDGEPNYQTPMIYYTTEDELVWPEHLKGGIYAIGAITSLVKYGD